MVWPFIHSSVLLHGTICFSIFSKLKFGIFLEFLFFALLEVKRVNGACFQLSVLMFCANTRGIIAMNNRLCLAKRNPRFILVNSNLSK